MAESGIKSYFPSQTVSDAEKLSYDYGLKVGKAIEQEWFNNDRGSNRYKANSNDFHNLRLYARGEQSIQKYKDELSINGDLSYLNLDWKPIPIISKFVDIVANGMSERLYDIKAYSQDPFGVSKRTKYMEDIISDMKSKEFNNYTMSNLQIDLRKSDIETLPDTQEELDLHMQLNYKQAVEIAEEQALSVLLEGNNYELIKKQFYYKTTPNEFTFKFIFMLCVCLYKITINRIKTIVYTDSLLGIIYRVFCSSCHLFIFKETIKLI